MDFDEDPGYLDLDDILAQTQFVNCKFLLNIPGLDFLWPMRSQDARRGAEVLLPFWMAKTLYTYSMIDIDLPKVYSEGFREKLRDEPDVIDLHRAGPHYYGFGKLLLNLRREKGNNLSAYTEEGQRNKYRREEGETLDERASIASCLLNTFHLRRHKLLEYSINKAAAQNDSNFEKTKAFASRLDNLEKRLFQMGRQQVEETNKWMSRKIELISNNALATRLTKRRRLEDRIASSSSQNTS